MCNGNLENSRSLYSEFASALGPYEPQLPLDELVLQMNRIYHRYEAQEFDSLHAPDFEQMASLWREMLDCASTERQSEKLRILDFGCGTGFEASQLLLHVPRSNIEHLTCYDASPDMLSQCISKISPLFSDVSFCSTLEDIPTDKGFYNVLLTNQMLHHLTDVPGTIKSLIPILSGDALWMSGHEPSSRYFRNPECWKIYRAFLKEHKWRRFLAPEKYIRRFKRAVGLEKNIELLAAREAVQRGLFKRALPSDLVVLVVDFQSIRSAQEASESGRGLDFEVLEKDFSHLFHLIFLKTYNFMGSFEESGLPRKWVLAARDLQERFPKDGSDYSAVWKRIL
jgi:2-polyprenyl-3-methyl-5-hydroxy-6-metoxy-1,4-benzoquinol methylase